jgi:hypothetical protein
MEKRSSPPRLEDFLWRLPDVLLAIKGPFYEIYEGIYSRLFLFVEHEDAYSSENINAGKFYRSLRG